MLLKQTLTLTPHFSILILGEKEIFGLSKKMIKKYYLCI